MSFAEELGMCVAHRSPSGIFDKFHLSSQSHLSSNYIGISYSFMYCFRAVLKEQGRKYVKKFINSLLADEKWDSFRPTCSN